NDKKNKPRFKKHVIASKKKLVETHSEKIFHLQARIMELHKHKEWAERKEDCSYYLTCTGRVMVGIIVVKVDGQEKLKLSDVKDPRHLLDRILDVEGKRNTPQEHVKQDLIAFNDNQQNLMDLNKRLELILKSQSKVIMLIKFYLDQNLHVEFMSNQSFQEIMDILDARVQATDFSTMLRDYIEA
ncbi:hypothetical protein HK100_008212, partial [Physocladia obscura]